MALVLPMGGARTIERGEEEEYRGREWRGREGGKVEREREDKCMVGN